MSVLGKFFGNNVTKPEQKGCKTRAKGVVKIESMDSKPSVVYFFHDQSIAFIFAIKKSKKYEFKNQDTKTDLPNRISMAREWFIPSIVLRTTEVEHDYFCHLD